MKKGVNASDYSCELVLERTTVEKTKDSSFTNDAYLIWYKVEDELLLDLCRASKMVDLFDFYYDKYGAGSIQKIDFGYGRTNPKLWGYKVKESKSKK